MEKHVFRPKLTWAERVQRVVMKWLPDKVAALRMMQRLPGHRRYVSAFYKTATPLLMSVFGGHNIHAGYFEHGDEDWIEAQNRLTEVVGEACAFRPGMEVLDVGCGVGGPSLIMAERCACQVTGLNIVKRQVKRAREYATERGMADQTRFVHGDAMRMPFDDKRFDGAYAIESMTHMPDKEAFVAEVARVTRPGARFGIIDACLHDRASLRSQPEAEFFSVVIGLRLSQWMELPDVPHALENHGFTLIENRDLSERVRRTYEIAGEYVRSRQKDLVKMYDQETYEMTERIMREGFKLLLEHGTYRLWVAVRTGSIG